MKVYRHYKGGIYTVIGIATHSETEEQLVVYKNEEGRLFVRPHDMFFETIEIDGKLVKRFEEIKDKAAQ